MEDIEPISSGYIHETLTDGSRFRLLRLLPGARSDPIQCELLHVTFESAPVYETVSYCWGDATDQVTILCGGKPYSITSSLFQGLRRFRWESKPRLLWADGICINQGSKHERRQQVSFMGQIYAGGRGNLIWLGENPEDADVAGGVTLIKEFNSYMDAMMGRAEPGDREDLWSRIHAVPPIPDDHPLVCGPRASARWQSVQQLLARPWFTRTWVMQEVGLSRKATAFAGDVYLPLGDIALFAFYCSHMAKFCDPLRSVAWERIYHAVTDIWSTFNNRESWMGYVHTLEAVRTYFHGHHAQSQNGMLDVLEASRDLSSSESLDHIYALLGHPLARSSDGRSAIVDPDYTLSIEQATLALARQICLKARSPRLLCWVQHWDESDVQGGALPSWVPTWHLAGRYPDRIHSQRFPDASLAEKTGHLVVADVQGDKLRVAARVLDTVQATSEPLSGNIKDVTQTVRDCWNVYSACLRTSSPPTPQQWDNFLFSLVRSYPMPSLLRSDFVAFCQRSGSPDLVDLVQHHALLREAALAPPDHTNHHRFADRVRAFGSSRRFFVTTDGICGMGLRPGQKGDVLAIILGTPMPVLLRPKTDGAADDFWFVSQSFVHGKMYGEVFENEESSQWVQKISSITLV